MTPRRATRNRPTSSNPLATVPRGGPSTRGTGFVWAPVLGYSILTALGALFVDRMAAVAQGVQAGTLAESEAETLRLQILRDCADARDAGLIPSSECEIVIGTYKQASQTPAWVWPAVGIAGAVLVTMILVGRKK